MADEMTAVRLHGVGDLRVETISRPPGPGAGEVLLRLLAAGICGSDLHNFQTGAWIAHLPVTPGHEFCAEIVAVGPDVTAWQVGQRVVVDSRAVCGECESCAVGETNLCEQLGFVGELCDGAFGEWCLQPVERLIAVPDDVASEVAALAEPLGVALHVLKRLAPHPDQPLVIVGGGTIGGLVALLARDMALGPLLLVERNAERAALLERVCGVEALTFDALADRRPRLAVEATGSAAALKALIDSMGRGSRVALVGLFHQLAELDANLLVEREIDLIGCSVFRDEQREVMARLAALAPALRELCESPISLEAVPARYTSLIAGGGARLKSLVVPSVCDAKPSEEI
ncbi:zinc-dependent alcohol dehydrogenase [Salinicola rhizosphaerae]|uniref:Dehydrogenase n=1 Tax=Salinicola rhizosphaerae TaxID=1443141 RepID=A0ABQ3DXJ6_9GAMM|nr:alcohol dehydrogenase catalytic domain-containing protein [Salinicola rhizosphaerae]GHB18295.1 dehydrogenase [Salinicola rhizosphaerae]